MVSGQANALASPLALRNFYRQEMDPNHIPVSPTVGEDEYTGHIPELKRDFRTKEELLKRFFEIPPRPKSDRAGEITASGVVLPPDKGTSASREEKKEEKERVFATTMKRCVSLSLESSRAQRTDVIRVRNPTNTFYFNSSGPKKAQN